MALPPGITPKTVTIGVASFFDGSIADGTVTITAPANVIHTPTNRPIFSSAMSQRFVDGVASFNLCPTDAAGLNRVDWTYSARIVITGALVQPDPIWFTLPTAGPDTIDLDGLVTVPSSAGIPISVDVLTTEDLPAAIATGIEDAVTDPASATSVALRATYGTVLAFTDPRIGGKGDGTTDNTAAFNAALALLAPTGGELSFPPGIYRINGATDPVPGGIWLTGTGYDYHTPASATTDRPAKHSIIRAGAAMTRLIQLGTDANVSTSGQTGASIEKLVLDGNGLAATTLKLAARRNRVINSEIYGGTQTGVWVGGQNGHVIGCVIDQHDVGDVVLVQGFWDNKVWQNQLRGVGATGACVRIVGAQNTDIQLNHMWAGGNGVSAAAEGLIVVATPGSDPNGITTHTLITDNTIESGQCPHVLVKSVSGGAIIRGVLINSNRFYQQTPFNDLQAPVVRFAGQGNISNVAVNDNMMTGIDTTHRYSSILDVDNTGPLQSANRISMIGNSGTFVAALTTGSLPTGSTALYSRGNYIQNGSASVLSDKTGRATFSGTGAQTAFTIPHGLASAPSSQRVVAGSAAAAGLFYVTADATNLTVTFTTAPATGTNNVVLNWQAEV